MNCKMCGGSGRIPCGLCEGIGIDLAPNRIDANPSLLHRIKERRGEYHSPRGHGIITLSERNNMSSSLCPLCNGTGFYTCPSCNGTGMTNNGDSD